MKAIITDFDGTLVRTDKTISTYTRDVLMKCRERGDVLIAATARPERSIAKYRALIEFDAIITMNGARIILPDRVFKNSILKPSGERILSQLSAIDGAVISIETDDGIYSNTAIPEWQSKVYNGFPLLPDSGALYKILVSGERDVLHERIKRALTDDTYYTVAENKLFQIMSKNATKLKGVDCALEYFGVPRSRAVYFGDDNDDIEPIRSCGTGVAVSNAIAEVLSAADYVTDGNDCDGVAAYIEKYLL